MFMLLHPISETTHGDTIEVLKEALDEQNLSYLSSFDREGIETVYPVCSRIAHLEDCKVNFNMHGTIVTIC